MSDFSTLMAPQHVLCVLTADADLADVARLAKESAFRLDADYSREEPDPDMADAFSSCADETFTDADRAAVDAHRGVAYLTSGQFLPRELTAENSARTLELVGALLAAGALAVKHETSILAHGRDEWLALAADGGPIAQRKAWVRMPLGAPGVLYSCGMHLVGRPDVEIEHDGNPDRLPEWVGLMSALADYQLTEERGTEIADGEGFRMAPDSPRWTLHRTACDRYEEGDLSHNPYGYWRLHEDEAAASGD